MKIIAKMAENNILVEMTTCEFNLITGKRVKDNSGLVAFGAAVDVEKNWYALETLVAQKETITKNINFLRSFANILENLPNIEN